MQQQQPATVIIAGKWLYGNPIKMIAISIKLFNVDIWWIMKSCAWDDNCITYQRVMKIV